MSDERQYLSLEELLRDVSNDTIADVADNASDIATIESTGGVRVSDMASVETPNGAITTFTFIDPSTSSPIPAFIRYTEIVVVRSAGVDTIAVRGTDYDDANFASGSIEFQAGHIPGVGDSVRMTANKPIV